MFSKADIEKYFIAEKQAGMVFLIIGMVAIIVALIFLLALKTSFYKGMAMPLIVVGLLMGIVGFTVYQRSNADRTRNVYAYDMNPGELKNKELPRMEKVMKDLVRYHYAEMLLAIIGVVLFFYFKNNAAQALWKGVGAGLIITMLVATASDFAAAKRARPYLHGLRTFTAANQ
jgi:uncharacterized membrane protein